MPVASYTVNFHVGGVTISKTINRTVDHPNPYEKSVAAASAGTVNAVNAAANTCNIELGANHGLTNGTFTAFYGTSNVRYGFTGAITGNTLAASAGSGDAWPSNNTACVLAKVTALNTAIDGDQVSMIGMLLEDSNTSSTKRAHIKFMDSTNAEIAQIELEANTPRIWDITGGDTNDFTGNPITHAEVAHNDTGSAHTVKIGSGENAAV